MAYNPYFPATYQPYQQPYYQPVMQQPVQAQPPVQQPQPSSIIWVSGEREAQMYPVAPNNAVTLWSQTEPVVYLKQADATGKPTLKVYDLVERSVGVSPVGDKAEEYATKADLTGVLGAVQTLKTDIETMKGDIYGLAGKRKPVKKTEDEE